MASDDKSKPVPPHRDKAIVVRVDDELHSQAMDAARPYGGLSGVIRAFLRAFVSGERNFDVDALAQENTPAPKRPRKPKPSKSKRK